ncbi:hypothetical protein BDV25DRAFT_16486 [Aspergillus avenaceus]|uniref:Uncharacterized protein n=1 Tax=Aspergillus avenaceus TaxID=36643 RepID=A0A5N6TQ93_ASPAV|nr:hypothetical protein BDV25DRAFT_16486 [Aspergillus avenaceus]
MLPGTVLRLVAWSQSMRLFMPLGTCLLCQASSHVHLVPSFLVLITLTWTRSRARTFFDRYGKRYLIMCPIILKHLYPLLISPFLSNSVFLLSVRATREAASFEYRDRYYGDLLPKSLLDCFIFLVSFSFPLSRFEIICTSGRLLDSSLSFVNPFTFDFLNLCFSLSGTITSYVVGECCPHC